MSAQTADSESLPPVPEGWQRVRPGSPLCETTDKEKRALQFCPVCGPEAVVIPINESGGRRFDQHLEEVHGGHPEDFGLPPYGGAKNNRFTDYEGET